MWEDPPKGSACGPALSRPLGTHWGTSAWDLGLSGSATRVAGLTVEKLPVRVLVLQSADGSARTLAGPSAEPRPNTGSSRMPSGAGWSTPAAGIRTPGREN